MPTQRLMAISWVLELRSHMQYTVTNIYINNSLPLRRSKYSEWPYVTMTLITLLVTSCKDMAMSLFPSMMEPPVYIIENKLHLNQKNYTFSLVRSREVKKLIWGKKLEKTSNMTARMVIFTGVVDSQRYGRSLHMLIRSVTLWRNSIFKLPLTWICSMV